MLSHVMLQDNLGHNMYYAGDAYPYTNPHEDLPANLASLSFDVVND